MELDEHTFWRIEIFAWAVTAFFLFFVFGYFFVFIGIAVGVRYAYLLYKNSKLELLETQDKSVLVTGCDTGFGLGLAMRLSNRGFNVFAACLNPESEGAKALKQRETTHHLTVLHLDVTSDSQVEEVLKRVQKECDDKGLWGLVNNAGQDFIGDAEMTTMEQYQHVANVNLFGTVRMCKAFLPLVRQAKGRIITVSSIKGLITFPTTAAYTITKHGIEAFSDVLRQEMAGFKVKVIVMEPGNFGGATGCLNDSGIARMKGQLEAQWEDASKEAKQFYGQAHLQKLVEEARKSAGTTHPSIEPVLEAFEDALRNVCPKVRYMIDGSNSYIDIYATLARLYPFLPQRVFDKMRTYFFPYIIYK